MATLRFRIGINLGDVIAEDESIFGDGVNVATRLGSLAEPGGICISEDVYRHANGKIEAAFEDMGNQDLKNVSEPIRGYKVLTSKSSTLPESSALLPLPPPDKPSIAVLPFENNSGDQEQAFLADGITEGIITTLSKISRLFVIARNSVLMYKEKTVDALAAGRELGVPISWKAACGVAGTRFALTRN